MSAAGGRPDRIGVYVGRFAPSPTGPLHFGSLVAAVASYVDARANRGRWLLRIEDLDPPRESKAAAKSFPVILDRYGFEWDGPILYQSTRAEAYAAALEALIRDGRAFPCGCSRGELAMARLGDGGERIYPGTCRNGLPPGRHGRAWRARVETVTVTFADRIQGAVTQDLSADVGDFVVRRADGFWAYQLAVVVDDRDQGITDVVRGADLLASTPRQIWLQRHLSAATPRYAHVPIVVNALGEKLSKQTLADALPVDGTVSALLAAWRFLGQRAPEQSATRSLGCVDEFWQWAIAHWNPSSVHGRAKPYPEPRETDRL